MAENRTCIECGFLTIQGRELSRAERAMLATHGTSAAMPPDCKQTQCFKSLWVEYDLIYAIPDFQGVIREIGRNRDDCSGFMRYEAGFDPAQHREIQLEQRKRGGRRGRLTEIEESPEAQGEEKEVTETGNIFRKEGDAWEIFFDGKPVRNINQSKGMEYIKYLLEHPGRYVPASAFIQTPPTSEEASLLDKMHEVQLEELNLSKSKSPKGKHKVRLSGEMLERERQTKEKFRKEIKELDEIINDPDSLQEEVLKAETKKEFILKELKASYDRSAENSRTAVANAITRAITHIRKHHRPLADHLKKHIQLGNRCIYSPPDNPDWNK